MRHAKAALTATFGLGLFTIMKLVAVIHIDYQLDFEVA